MLRSTESSILSPSAVGELAEWPIASASKAEELKLKGSVGSNPTLTASVHSPLLYIDVVHVLWRGTIPAKFRMRVRFPP